MLNYLIIAISVILLSGCRGEQAQPDVNDRPVSTHKGKYHVPQKDLPPPVIEWANDLDRLPEISSLSEFQSSLAEYGLSQEPDFYKDNAHYWYFDQDFESETALEKRMYRVSIGYTSTLSGAVKFQYAAISRENSTDLSRKRLWEISWPSGPGK